MPQTYPYAYWMWGDEGSLANPVTYGLEPSGLTYTTAGMMPVSGTPMSIIVDTFNSENWRVDSSKLVFNAP
jgi:hypothetical protein